MSFYLPESNVSQQGSAGAVRVNLPTGASYKPANRGCVFGMWVETPLGGYEGNFSYNVVSKWEGYTGGADGYLRFSQDGTQLAALIKQAGTTYVNATLTGIPAAKKLLVMLIVNPTNYHVVACEPGGSPLVQTVANTTTYAANFSAVDFWSRFSIGNSAGYGHYGPIEEAFFLLGEFPESASVPDSTLIQNIASGVQDLATLDAQLTGTVAKKWRYRMMQQDDLSDAYGIAGNLTVTNATADKPVLSGGSLRPIALRPNDTCALASMVTFGTIGNTATATTDINIEGGTYSGISPAAIQARLRKEDGTVHVNWTTIDAAPTGGTWAAGTLTGVAYVAGWLTCDIRAVDGVGAQIGDIVSSRGWKGTGVNLVLESQSQGTFLQDTGNGMASSAGARLQVVHNNSTGTAWRIKKITIGNQNARVARGVRQFAEEIHALFPGMPISWSSVGVQGSPLEEWVTGGAFAGLWAELKTIHGTPQPFRLYMLGHASPTALYETVMGSVIAKCTSDYAAPMGVLHAGTARYAGAGTSGSYTAASDAREGIRDRVANNPSTDWYAAHPQVVKCNASDTGAHPFDGDVGQGRHGALLAWGLMGKVKAVDYEPATITGAVKQAGGTEVRLVIGPVNQSSGVTANVDPASITPVGQDIGVSVTGGGVTVAVDPASITIAGQGIGIARTVPASPAAIALAGQDVGVSVTGGGTTVSVAPAAIALVGQDIGTSITGGGASVSITPAVVAVAGQVIGISRSLPVSPASFVLIGQNIGVSIAGGGSVSVDVGPVAITLTGQNVSISVSGAGLSSRRIATEAESRNSGIVSRG